MLHSNKKTFLASLLAFALLISNFGILGLSSNILAEEDLAMSDTVNDQVESEGEAEEPEEKTEAADQTDLSLSDSSETEDSANTNTNISGENAIVPEDAEATPEKAEAIPEEEAISENNGSDQEVSSTEEGSSQPVDTDSEEGSILTDNANPADTENQETDSSAEAEEPATPEPTDKEAETPSEEDSTGAENADDGNGMPEDLVLIHLEPTGEGHKLREDKLRTEEGNKAEGVTVFKDQNGAYHYAKKADGNNPYYELTDLRSVSTTIDEDGVKTTVEYKYFVESKTNTPVYQKIVTIDNQGTETIEKSELLKWEYNDNTHTYFIKPEDDATEVKTLQAVNRLEDVDDQGKIKSEYFVGGDSPLNFDLQYKPSADGLATLAISLKDEKGILDLSKVSVTDFRYAGKNQKVIQDAEGNYIVRFTGGDYGAGSLRINLPQLKGRQGDQISLTITAIQNGEVKTITRQFTVTESAFGEPGVKIDNQTYNEKAPLVIEGGQNQPDGTIAESEAKDVAAELIYEATDDWADQPILRADVLKGKELNYLTVVVDLPHDADSNVYAQYLHKQGIKFEEIRNEQGQVSQLRLQLERKNIEANTELKLETSIDENGTKTSYLSLNDKELLNAVLTDYVLTQKDLNGNETSVYVTENGSYKLTKDLYQKIGNSGYKFRGQELLDADNQLVATLTKEGGLVNTEGKEVNLAKKDSNSDELELVLVEDGQEHLKFLKEGDQLFSYTDKLLLGVGNVVNEYLKDDQDEFIKDNNGEKIAKANPFLEFVAGESQKLVNIVIEKTEDKVNKQYYGGTILLDQALNKDADGNQHYQVVDQYGNALKFTAALVEAANDATKTVWKFFRNDDQTGKYTKIADGTERDGIRLSTTTDNLILDTLHAIKEQSASKDKFTNYQAIAPDQIVPGEQGRYAYDKEKDIFINANGSNESNVRGLNYYKDLNNVSGLISSEEWIVDYTKKYKPESDGMAEWIDDSEESSNKTETIFSRKIGGKNNYDKELFGSLDNKNYFMVYGHIYELAQEGEALLLTNVDGKAKNTPFISNNNLQQTVRIYEDGRLENLGQADIYQTFTNARKFGLKFTGFHASTPTEREKNPDDISNNKLYELKASYTLEDPENSKNTKTYDTSTKFWLNSLESDPQAEFSKSAPAGLTAQMDNEVFNLLYRAKDDRARDAVLNRLFNPDTKDLTSAEQTFKEKIKSEYKRVYGEDFEWQVGDEADNSKLVRNLAWTIQLSNSASQTLPQDLTSYLIFEDSQLDNRLVYESLTFNLSREAYLNAEKTAKDSNEEFKGNANLTFLEDVGEILFGVDTHAKEGGKPVFSRVKGWGLNLSDEGQNGLLARIINAYNSYANPQADEENLPETQTLELGEEDIAGESKIETSMPKRLQLTFNKALGQVTISIRDFFWSKEQETSPDNEEAGSDQGEREGSNAYFSPVQKAYEEERQRLITILSDEDPENKIDSYQDLVDLMTQGNRTLEDCMGHALGILDKEGNLVSDITVDENGKPQVDEETL